MKRMYRLQEEARFAGICSGVGFYFGIDPVVIRLGWVVVTIFTGFVPGLLVYLLAWLIMPEAPQPSVTEPAQAQASPDRPQERPV